jgi:hypothetical protein
METKSEIGRWLVGRIDHFGIERLVRHVSELPIAEAAERLTPIEAINFALSISGPRMGWKLRGANADSIVTAIELAQSRDAETIAIAWLRAFFSLTAKDARNAVKAAEDNRARRAARGRG